MYPTNTLIKHTHTHYLTLAIHTRALGLPARNTAIAADYAVFVLELVALVDINGDFPFGESLAVHPSWILPIAECVAVTHDAYALPHVGLVACRRDF